MNNQVAERIMLEEYNDNIFHLPEATSIADVAKSIGASNHVISEDGVVHWEKFDSEKAFREAIRVEVNFFELVEGENQYDDSAMNFYQKEICDCRVGCPRCDDDVRGFALD